jgi:hypothetical protein
MKARQPELRGIPQFDSGRWKLRLERVPLCTDNQPDNQHDSCEIETAIPVSASQRFRSDAELHRGRRDSGERLPISQLDARLARKSPIGS